MVNIWLIKCTGAMQALAEDEMAHIDQLDELANTALWLVCDDSDVPFVGMQRLLDDHGMLDFYDTDDDTT